VVVVPRVGMGVYRVDLGGRVHEENGFRLGLECDGPNASDQPSGSRIARGQHSGCSHVSARRASRQAN
jgi:hypothetical protein